MKQIFLIALIIGVNFIGFSQENTDEKLFIDSNISSDSIIKAKPKNDIEEFKIEFAKTLNLSVNRILEINQRKVRIITNFNIDENGKISNIKIINDKFKLKDEVSDALSKMPNWIPAQKDGKNIASNQSLQIILNLGLPDYELDENRIPKVVLHKKDFDAFHYEFNSHMIYPRDFFERYHYKNDGYDSGNKS